MWMRWTCACSLATCLADAEAMHKEALRIYELELGPESVDVAATLNHLALLHVGVGVGGRGGVGGGGGGGGGGKGGGGHGGSSVAARAAGAVAGGGDVTARVNAFDNVPRRNRLRLSRSDVAAASSVAPHNPAHAALVQELCSAVQTLSPTAVVNAFDNARAALDSAAPAGRLCEASAPRG